MLTDEQIAWEPGPDVTDHDGQPVDPAMDFFAPPPPEIGAVRSARSTLKKGRRPLSPAVQFVILFVPGMVGIAALQLAGLGNAYWQVGLFMGLFAIGWLLTRFAYSCNYVGSEGIATFRCKRNRDRIARRDVFLFRDAAELRTSQTRHYHNGIYTGTNYSYIWTDGEGRKVHTLSGTYRGEKKLPKPKDPYHLALAAETAWSVYLFDHLQHQLTTEGVIHFRLGGPDWVGVGPGFLDLCMKGEMQRCVAKEIANITIKDGVLQVARTDAKQGWFRSSGVFRFPYGNMANAKLFLFAVGRLLGVPIV